MLRLSSYFANILSWLKTTGTGCFINNTLKHIKTSSDSIKMF